MRPARKAPPHRQPVVCLYWLHPLLLTEFQHQLPPSDFRLSGFQLEAYSMPDLGKLSCPRAALYAVESHPRRLFTEAIVSAIAGRSLNARVLVIADAFREANAFPLLRLGVKGLLMYSELPSQLTRAVGVIASGGFWVPRALLSAFLDRMRGSPHTRPPSTTGGDLTAREQQVLEGLLQNLSNKEIAKKLQISERTAKFHVSNLLAKFGVQRRADLILLSTAAGPEK